MCAADKASVCWLGIMERKRRKSLLSYAIRTSTHTQDGYVDKTKAVSQNFGS